MVEVRTIMVCVLCVFRECSKLQPSTNASLRVSSNFSHHCGLTPKPVFYFSVCHFNHFHFRTIHAVTAFRLKMFSVSLFFIFILLPVCIDGVNVNFILAHLNGSFPKSTNFAISPQGVPYDIRSFFAHFTHSHILIQSRRGFPMNFYQFHSILHLNHSITFFKFRNHTFPNSAICHFQPISKKDQKDQILPLFFKSPLTTSYIRHFPF